MKWKLGLYRGYIGDIVFYLMASKQGISVGAEGRSWVWEPG